VAIPRNLIQILITAKNASSSELRKATKDLNDLEKTLLKTSSAAAAAGTAVAASLFLMAQRAAKTADEFKKFERATGTQANTLAALRFAIQRWGGTQRDADTSLRRFTKAVADANSGLDSYVRVFKRLDIEQKDLVGSNGSLKSLDELLPLVAEKFAGLGDDILAASTAQILFGRGGLRIIPLLKQGAEGLKEMADRAERLGILFSDEQLFQAEKFQDAMLDIRQSAEGLTFAIGFQLMPVIRRYTEAMTDNIVKIKDWINAHEDLSFSIAGVAAGLIGAGGLVFALTTTVIGVRAFIFAMKGAAGPIAILIGLLALVIAKIVEMKLKADDLPRTLSGIDAAIMGNLAAQESLLQQIATLQENVGKTSILTGEKITEKDIEPFVAKLLEKYEGILATNEKLLGVRKDIVATLNKERLSEEAIAALEERRRQRIQEMERLLRDLPAAFELKLRTGDASTVDAINRQKRIIDELTVSYEKSQEAVALASGNLETYEIALEAALEAGNKLAQAEGKLLDLFERFREETEKTADGIDRVRTEMEALQEQIEDLERQLSGEEERMAARAEQIEAQIQAATGVLTAFFQTTLTNIHNMMVGLKVRWENIWNAMTAAAIAALSRVLAKALAVAFITSLLPGVGGAILGAPVRPVLPPGVTTAASGGQITKGSFFADTVPLFARRGENVLDRRSNDRLNAFLDAAEEGGFGRTNISINPGLSTGTRMETKRMARVVSKSIERLKSEVTAKGSP
jgi:cytochrome c556